MEFDVVVAGSGAAGLTTAVVAAKRGLKVLLVEKSRYIGGTTALSLGAPWVVANKFQAQLNLEDDQSAGVEYLQSVLGDLYDPSRVEAFLSSGSEMVEFMSSKCGVEWVGMPLPDYFPDAAGARVGRTMVTAPFDGSVLGRKWLRRMRPVLPGFSILGGLQVDMLESSRLQNVFGGVGDFIYTTLKLLRYVKDRMVFGRGAFLANGNALVGQLLKAALDSGVTVWVNAPLMGLERMGSRIVGVTVQNFGEAVEIKVNCGVALACGGFGSNAEWRKKFIPMAASHHSLQPHENVGDGIRLGLDVGAVLPEGNAHNGIWAPVSVRVNEDGSVDKYPHFGPDRGKPGSLIVDSQGERFANEAAPYQTFVSSMQEKGIASAYFIGDRRFLRDYGMGFALPSPMPYSKLTRNGYLIEADSLAGLAGKLKINKEKFLQTVSEFNRHAGKGEDPVFFRGANAYDNSQGDPSHKPNPNLRSLDDTGPYYAVCLHPGDVSSVLGLSTDEDARVLSADGTAIDGLYAVGLDQNTVMRGIYPGGGSGIGPGMTFGYRAALHMSEK
jgi:succinate dehydrogenase/fumarate reductase flavoprotein subunit